MVRGYPLAVWRSTGYWPVMVLYEIFKVAHQGWATPGKRISDVQLPCILVSLVSVGPGHERAAEPDKVLSISTSGAGRLFATNGCKQHGWGQALAVGNGLPVTIPSQGMWRPEQALQPAPNATLQTVTPPTSLTPRKELRYQRPCKARPSVQRAGTPRLTEQLCATPRRCGSPQGIS